MAAVPSTLTFAQWQAIVESFDGRCAYCGVKCAVTMDHVVPVAKGGPHTADNVVPACVSCNSSKKDRGILFDARRRVFACRTQF